MELIVGKILKPQGIRGEVKVKPFTDDGTVFKDFKRVFIEGAEYKILSVRVSPEAVFLGLRGVPDRNAAELLRGKDLTVPRAEAPEPEEGAYYIADILGSEIYTEEGELLGILKDIRPASSDIYTMESGGKEVLFPAAKGVITEINAAEKRITVNKKRYLEVAVL